jgi:ribosomal protein L18E
VSTNPNYELSAVSGSVTERPYPSPRVTRIILLSVFSLAVLFLLLILGIRGRDNIRAGFAAATCRWQNRKRKVPPPKAFVHYPEEYSALPDLPPKDQTDILSLGETKTATEESEKPYTETYPAEHKDGAERKISDGNRAPVEAHGEPLDDSDLFLSHHIGEALEALSVDMERADELISDSLAKELVKKSRESIVTAGNQKGIINVDTLSESFSDGERVDINILKSKGLLSDNTAYLKVLARGSIDKPLSVYANDFSLSAVKMIALTGGEAVKVVTVKKNTREFGDNP